MTVVDASVLLKWFLPDEPGAEQALALRDAHLAGLQRIAVPALLLYEVASILGRTLRLTEDEAATAFETLDGTQLTFYVPGLPGLQRIVELMRAAGISAYDAAYVALAERLDADFVTADKRLARKLEGVELNCTVRTL